MILYEPINILVIGYIAAINVLVFDQGVGRFKGGLFIFSMPNQTSGACNFHVGLFHQIVEMERRH